MSKDRPNCTPKIHIAKPGVGCLKKPNKFNCVVKPSAMTVVKTLNDKCLKEHVIHNGLQDPYLQHMPKHDTGAAISYSMKMGGENSDITCEIL